MTTTIYLLILALIAGGVAGYYLRRLISQKRVSTAETKAEKILRDAKAKEQELLLGAREKALKIIDEAKREEEGRRHELQQEKKRLESRETLFDKKLLEFEERQQKLSEKINQVETVKA